MKCIFCNRKIEVFEDCAPKIGSEFDDRRDKTELRGSSLPIFCNICWPYLQETHCCDQCFDKRARNIKGSISHVSHQASKIHDDEHKSVDLV